MSVELSAVNCSDSDSGVTESVLLFRDDVHSYKEMILYSNLLQLYMHLTNISLSRKLDCDFCSNFCYILILFV